MRSLKKLALFVLLAPLIANLAACNYLKKKIDQNIQQKETISLDLVPDWTPLYAISYDNVPLNAFCSSKLMSIDSFVSASSYASVWNSVKNNLYAVNILDLIYATEGNQSENGGSLDLYMVGSLPSGLQVPQGVANELHIDTSAWEIVRASELNSADKVASLPIPSGRENVAEWGDANYVGNGQSELESQFMDYNANFAFCVVLNITPHAFTTTPDLKFELHTDVQLVFVPL
jgi:hypothetical protein